MLTDAYRFLIRPWEGTFRARPRVPQCPVFPIDGRQPSIIRRSEGPAVSAVVARESAALALDLLRRSLSRGLGLAVEEEIEAHADLVLDPKEEILRRLDAEVAHLEPALAAYPEPSLLQADTAREALHALDARDGQPP